MSIAQARRVAAVWGSGGRCKITETLSDGREAYRDPTDRVCLARGWLVRDGVLTEMQSGAFNRDYVVSIAALDALEDFLRETRFKALKPRIAG